MRFSPLVGVSAAVLLLVPISAVQAASTCGPTPNLHGCGKNPRCTSDGWIWTELPDGSACNDGNAATYNDVCSGGYCRGTPLPTKPRAFSLHNPANRAVVSRYPYLLSWQRPADVVDFVVTVTGNDGRPPRRFVRTTSNVYAEPLHLDPSASLDGTIVLEAGRAYTWSVVARNAAGQTASNETFTFFTGGPSTFTVQNPHRNFPYYFSGQFHAHTYTPPAREAVNIVLDSSNCSPYMKGTAPNAGAPPFGIGDYQPWGQIVDLYAYVLDYSFVGISDHWTEHGVTHYSCRSGMACFEGKEGTVTGHPHWLLVGTSISTDTSRGWPGAAEASANLSVLAHPGWPAVNNEWYYPFTSDLIYGPAYDGWEIPGHWSEFDVAQEYARISGKSYWIFKNDDYHPNTNYAPDLSGYYTFCGLRQGWNVVNSAQGAPNTADLYVNMKNGNFFAVEITRNPWATPGLPVGGEAQATTGITVDVTPAGLISVFTGTTADHIEFVASGRTTSAVQSWDNERAVVGSAHYTNRASYQVTGGERYVQIKMMKTAIGPDGQSEVLTIYSQPLMVYP